MKKNIIHSAWICIAGFLHYNGSQDNNLSQEEKMQTLRWSKLQQKNTWSFLEQEVIKQNQVDAAVWKKHLCPDVVRQEEENASDSFTFCCFW